MSKKVEVDSAPSSRTESQVPSPQSVGGDVVIEDISVKEEPKVFPFKNTSYDVYDIYLPNHLIGNFIVSLHCRPKN